MFERYLKKPSTTSVGFLVLEKLNSSSARNNRKMSRQAAANQGHSTKSVSVHDHKSSQVPHYRGRSESKPAKEVLVSGVKANTKSMKGKSPLSSTKHDMVRD